MNDTSRPPGPAGLADISTPLLYNHWYVAGQAAEFREGFQSMHDKERGEFSEVHFKTDAAAVRMRRIVVELASANAAIHPERSRSCKLPDDAGPNNRVH